MSVSGTNRYADVSLTLEGQLCANLHVFDEPTANGVGRLSSATGEYPLSTLSKPHTEPSATVQTPGTVGTAVEGQVVPVVVKRPLMAVGSPSVKNTITFKAAG